jgi:predicted ATPase/transcriptional regulator with XRE-family HTH domain
MLMDEAMSFGAWLRRRRMALGLTQRAFAEHLGYAYSTYRKLEADERRPSSAFLDQLADHLGLSDTGRATLVLFGQTGVCNNVDELFPQGAPGAQAPPADRLAVFPRSSTPLIGRDHDLSQLVAMLRQPERRLITLVGPPGVGKTHLALQTLAALGGSAAVFPDGIVFVPLATITEPHLAILTIAHTLGLTESHQPPHRLLATFLRDQHLLLMLDNLEQVLDVGPLLAELLVACPGLSVLATSRAPLRVRAEQQFLVSPLALPDLSLPPDPAALAKVASVALFVARAQAIQQTFQLTHANSAAIAALCVQLDGLPLALELAAVHIKFFSPADLLEGITDRLDLLTNGPRDLPVYQQSLRAAIEQSYLLLGEAEQMLFRRLGVFAGGAPLAAVRALGGGQGAPLDAVHTITQLIDQNLVWIGAGPPQRVHMLETIRVYASEQLTARGEYDQTRERHVTYYSDWAAGLTARIRSSERVAILQELEGELGNLRAALGWCFAHPAQLHAGVRMASNLCPFWLGYGYLSEGRAWLEQAAAALGQQPSSKVQALGGASAAQPAAPKLHAQALCALGSIAIGQGDYSRAQPVLEQSLQIWRGIADPYGVGEALYWLGVVANHQGAGDAAQQHFEDSLVQFHSVSAHQRIADVCFELGFLVLQLQRDVPRATRLFQESLKHTHAYGDDPLAIADACFNLGLVAYLEGKDQEVLTWFDGEVLHDLLLCDRRRCVQALQLLGAAVSRLGDPRRAVRVWSAAARASQRMGLSIPQAYQAMYDQALQQARGQLDEGSFAEDWAAGQTMALAETVDDIAAVVAQACASSRLVRPHFTAHPNISGRGEGPSPRP